MCIHKNGFDDKWCPPYVDSVFLHYLVMPEFVQLIVYVAWNKNTVNIYLFELVTQVALFYWPSWRQSITQLLK